MRTASSKETNGAPSSPTAEFDPNNYCRPLVDKSPVYQQRDSESDLYIRPLPSDFPGNEKHATNPMSRRPASSRMTMLKVRLRADREATEVLNDLVTECDSPLDFMAEQVQEAHFLSLLTELQLQKAAKLHRERKGQAEIWEILYQEALGMLKPFEEAIHAAEEAAKQKILDNLSPFEPLFKHKAELALLPTFNITPERLAKHTDNETSNRA
ncbi:hypothetical protein BKA70DRAFT_17946 [Coprinopsis sp. MPI-PUGE-AT-0042]|nr:hypothetical protein BKA70DRAFT_17946 [Coprinopsis sp. MPI-PUGE-AT-0042]